MKNEGPEKHPVTRVAKRYGADAKSQLRGIEERMREFFGAHRSDCASAFSGDENFGTLASVLH